MAEGRREEKEKRVKSQKNYSVNMKFTLIQNYQPTLCSGLVPLLASGIEKIGCYLLPYNFYLLLPSALCPLPSSGHLTNSKLGKGSY
jgi:hypothetical protein